MPFELFTTDKAVPRGDPMVTITSYGRLALNKPATYRLEKEKVEYVQLLWDSETSRVGIAPAEKTKDSFMLAYGTNGNGAAFSCIPFLMYIKYDWRTTRNFGVNWNEESGMYVFTIGGEHLGTMISGDHIKRTSVPKELQKEKEIP